MADPLSSAVALLMVGAYPAALLGGLLWHQLSEGRRLAAARRDWAKLAARRGLLGGERPLHGGAWQVSYGGPLRGRHVTVTGQTSLPVHGWTNVRALLHPPLDLGLHGGPDPGWTGGTLGPTRPLLVADDPQRLTSLFDADVGARVRALGALDWTIADFGVLVRHRTFIPDPRVLDGLVERALDLCDALDRARSRVPIAEGLRPHEREWRRFAEARGLVTLGAPLAMTGTLDGVAVTVHARRIDRGRFGLGAEARFSRPLGGALGLTPTAAGAVASWLGVSAEDPGGEDWLLDDPAFDPTFLVRSRVPSRLPRMLPPELRARLLRLHERTPLLLDDVGIRLAAEQLPAPAAVPDLAVALAALAGEIEARVHDDGGSPYR